MTFICCRSVWNKQINLSSATALSPSVCVKPSSKLVGAAGRERETSVSFQRFLHELLEWLPLVWRTESEDCRAVLEGAEDGVGVKDHIQSSFLHTEIRVSQAYLSSKYTSFSSPAGIQKQAGGFLERGRFRGKFRSAMLPPFCNNANHTYLCVGQAMNQWPLHSVPHLFPIFMCIGSNTL